MSIEFNHKDFPQAVLENDDPGRIIITIKGVEVDITYDHSGIGVSVKQGDLQDKEIFADFDEEK